MKCPCCGKRGTKTKEQAYCYGLMGDNTVYKCACGVEFGEGFVRI